MDYVNQDVQRATVPAATSRPATGAVARVFLGVEGKLNNYFAYKAEGGWVNGGAASWDDVVIEYKPNEQVSPLFGNIKAAGLENLTSTRFVTFMDRGPYGDFGVDSYLLSAVAKVPRLQLLGHVRRPRQQHQHGRRRQRRRGLEGALRPDGPRSLRPDQHRHRQAPPGAVVPLP
ncbi:porin [Caulobacter segnis]